MYINTQVKDRFCTLLSERVNQLQKELNETKDNGEDSIDGVNETVKPKVGLHSVCYCDQFPLICYC